MNNKATDHNASNQLSHFLTALAKTRTLECFRSKVSRQTKHVHLFIASTEENKEGACKVSLWGALLSVEFIRNRIL